MTSREMRDTPLDDHYRRDFVLKQPSTVGPWVALGLGVTLLAFLTYLVYVMIVVSMGGLGSIWGSFAAAVVIGVSDVIGKYYVPRLGAFLIYLVMILLLMWRPNGLFGKR